MEFIIFRGGGGPENKQNIHYGEDKWGKYKTKMRVESGIKEVCGEI